MTKDVNLPAQRESLEESIGYKYKDETLLVCALTHSSFSNELRAKGKKIECNERLEFLRSPAGHAENAFRPHKTRLWRRCKKNEKKFIFPLARYNASVV